MPEEKIKLLIADDHALLRRGIRRILEAEPDMAVIGEAATGTDAVKQTMQLKPDIVIMDISMPGQNGIESMRQIIKSSKSRVLILSAYMEHELVSGVIASGAAGYLAKDYIDHELAYAVRTIVNTEAVISPNFSCRPDESSQRITVSRTLAMLTSREREVFLLLADGKSPHEIAASLSVRPRTVHTYRQRIIRKLGLRKNQV